jgi:small conductance mechanosensitive channel
VVELGISAAEPSAMQIPTAAGPIAETLVAQGFDLSKKLVGAFLLVVIGRFAIGLVKKAIEAALNRQHLDPTLKRYAESAAGVVMNLLLLLAVLSLFGINTTSFAAVFAAAALAIGTALSGLLSNFAAGVFLVVLRPFKVGDFVTAAGITGTVREIGLFVTGIDTPDNVRVYVGNNKLFSDNIQNFEANPFRRVELEAQLPHGVDPRDAIARLKERLKKIEGTVNEPSVEILRFTLAGPVLAVRPFCPNAVYWDVYFATTKAIVDAFTEAGYPVPEQHWSIRGVSELPR